MTKTPHITEEDCLKGEKEITVEMRDGKTRTLKVRSLNWRTAIAVIDLSMRSQGDSCLLALEHCLAGEDKEDYALNLLVPADLFMISNVAMLLTNGAGEAKKRMAAKQNHSASKTATPPKQD
jgi:hypothetical protein